MTDKQGIGDHLSDIEEKDPGSFKLIFTLGVAGFLSGLILVGIYILTLPAIEANKAEALKQAIYKVLPGCNSYIRLKNLGGQLVEEKEGGDKKQNKNAEYIYAGYNKAGDLIGFAIPSEEPGFQDLIIAIIGYDPYKKIIIGFEVLDSKETPGLGDRIKADPDFHANFKALAIDPEIVPVKKGKKQNSNEVETITGATISSKAVVRLLQNGMKKWRTPAENFTDKNQNK